MEINKYFNIHFERADDATIAKRLIGGAKIKGPALVILILSIFIASIGLNMNSTAVVIGAMLISPLMGPILATGFGFATLNFTVAKSGILRLSLQMTIAVLASALYFYISPVQTATSELLARTEPNIFDVFIAIFGGLAGIIGQTRKTLDNVIPGVAIATALMPPLCTAGYGLANGNWQYFIGAGYLFFINAFFIFFAAFIVLKGVYSLPFHEQAEERIRRNQLIFLVIGLIMAIPSIYAGYDMTIKYSESNHLEQFIKNDINQGGRRQVIDYSLDRTNKLVDLVVIGAPVNSEEQAQLDDKLQKDEYLQPYTLRFVNSVDENKSTMDKTNLNKSSENLEKYKNLSNQLIFLVIGFIMAIPSIYAGYDMTIKYSESNHLEQFIKNDINQDGRRQVIDYSLDRKNKLVDIVAIGVPVTSEEQAQLDDKLQKDDYLQPYTLRFVTSVDEKKSNMDKVNSNKSSENLEKYKNMSNLYQPTYQLVSETINTMKTTDAEAKALFPFVSKVEGMPLIDNLEEPKASRYMVIIHTTSTVSDADLARIKAWLEAKLSAPVTISIEQTTSTL